MITIKKIQDIRCQIVEENGGKRAVSEGNFGSVWSIRTVGNWRDSPCESFYRWFRHLMDEHEIRNQWEKWINFGGVAEHMRSDCWFHNQYIRCSNRGECPIYVVGDLGDVVEQIKKKIEEFNAAVEKNETKKFADDIPPHRETCDDDDDNYICCPRCGDEEHVEDAWFLEETDEYYCSEHCRDLVAEQIWAENHTVCDDCEEEFHYEDLVLRGTDTVCAACAEIRDNELALEIENEIHDEEAQANIDAALQAIDGIFDRAQRGQAARG